MRQLRPNMKCPSEHRGRRRRCRTSSPPCPGCHRLMSTCSTPTESACGLHHQELFWPNASLIFFPATKRRPHLREPPPRATKKQPSLREPPPVTSRPRATKKQP